jgi:prepilin-type N-terminal cleavage/methylation domain-containing protein
MNNAAYIKAFTLVEILVSLVITAIVMGIVFVIFSVMTERMMDFKNQNEPVSEMNRLTYAMNKDIFENTQMDLSGRQLVFESYSGSITKFRFYNNYFTRQKNDYVDTFRIAVSRISIDSLYTKNKKNAFLRLKLEATVNSNAINLKFYKKIYPQLFLKSG